MENSFQNVDPIKMIFKKLEEIKPKEILPGYSVRFVHSERMTFAYWDVKKGSQLPEHAHEHEQVANVLEGEYELTVAGKTQRLKPGDVAVIHPMFFIRELRLPIANSWMYLRRLGKII